MGASYLYGRKDWERRRQRATNCAPRTAWESWDRGSATEAQDDTVSIQLLSYKSQKNCN
jgi:hypothetical protein